MWACSLYGSTAPYIPRVKQETYTVIEWHEFEALVAEHLGDSDFNFVADMEARNDSEHVLDLRTQRISDEIELGWRRDISDWEKNTYQSSYGRPRYYLAKLIEKGVLPEDYPFLVTICW